MSDYYGHTLADFEVDMRVELHPAMDLWMAGVRYGMVKGVGRKYVTVKLDRLRRPRRIAPELLRPVR